MINGEQLLVNGYREDDARTLNKSWGRLSSLPSNSSDASSKQKDARTDLPSNDQ